MIHSKFSITGSVLDGNDASMGIDRVSNADTSNEQESDAKLYDDLMRAFEDYETNHEKSQIRFEVRKEKRQQAKQIQQKSTSVSSNSSGSNSNNNSSNKNKFSALHFEQLHQTTTPSIPARRALVLDDSDDFSEENNTTTTTTTTTTTSDSEISFEPVLVDEKRKEIEIQNRLAAFSMLGSTSNNARVEDIGINNNNDNKRTRIENHEETNGFDDSDELTFIQPEADERNAKRQRIQ
jgi:hypothetical protein